VKPLSRQDSYKNKATKSSTYLEGPTWQGHQACEKDGPKCRYNPGQGRQPTQLNNHVQLESQNMNKVHAQIEEAQDR
jgi:hypothetical protein